MSLQDLANLGEALGGLAVVLSLLFVGFELRQARATYQDSQLKQQVSRTIELGRDVSRHVDIWTRGHASYDALSVQEQVVFSSVLYAVTLDLSEQWVVYSEGKVDRSLWEIIDNNVRFFLGSPGAHQWWRSQPLAFHRGFVEWVEREVLPSGSGKPSPA
jgi:hypothetical protein